MTLELKHLVGYLPYGLKVASGDWYDEDCKLDRIGTMVMDYDNYTPNNISINQLWGNIDGRFKIDGVIRKKAKPILRPLSDLTKEVDGVVHLVELAKMFGGSMHSFSFSYSDCFLKPKNGSIKISDIHLFGYLFQHHFDVFSLIDNNLAIDINTIKS